MSQDWDIDDILASLDELLQEGKDDEPSKKVKQIAERATKNTHTALPQDTPKAQIKKSGESNTSSLQQSAPDSEVEHQQNSVEQVVEKNKLIPPRPMDVDVPDVDFRQEPSIDLEPAPPILPRVILTKDMMVDQGESIPDAFSGMLDAMEDDDVAASDEKTEATTDKLAGEGMPIHLNAQQVEQVLELVSIDVSYQFNQLLPDMIRKSLQSHLQMLQAEPVKKQEKSNSTKP